MINIAYAMGQSGAGGAQGSGGFTAFVPLIAMFAIFYFLLIRPQQKKSKEHREMVSNIKKGDRIITSGGIHGRVTAVSEAIMTVEIADKVRIKLARGNVTALVKSASPAQVSKDSKTKSD